MTTLKGKLVKSKQQHSSREYKLVFISRVAAFTFNLNYPINCMLIDIIENTIFLKLGLSVSDE